MFRSDHIKQLREKRKLSRTSLVFELDRLGLRISRPTLINWESGATEPKLSQAYYLSIFFRISLNDLLSHEKPKK